MITKAKTNALETLRALIAERQQYEQWIATLESKREGTPQHVFERVHGDYITRLQRVLTDIKGHAEELQLSISALSSRLIEVAREEDTRRDALQEAELRAMVGEYEPKEWEQLKSEAEQGLDRIGIDRAGLDSQLTELRSIQKLSEVGSTGGVDDAPATAPEIEAAVSNETPAVTASPLPAESQVQPEVAYQSAPVQPVADDAPGASLPTVPPVPVRDRQHLPLEQAVADSAAVLSAPPSAPQRNRTGKTPPFGSVPPKPKAPESRADQSKTLKCPECGTPNYATEWYCERCGGELATM